MRRERLRFCAARCSALIGALYLSLFTFTMQSPVFCALQCPCERNLKIGTKYANIHRKSTYQCRRSANQGESREHTSIAGMPILEEVMPHSAVRAIFVGVLLRSKRVSIDLVALRDFSNAHSRMWLIFTEAPAWPAWLGRPDDEAGPQALASQGELARLGPAYGGPAWPACWPEAGPCPSLVATNSVVSS